MGTGTWSSQSKAGYTYDILYQDEESDCGPCCCAMVVNLLNQGKPTSDIIQRAMPGGSYKKSTRDRAGMVATPLTGLAAEYHSPGTQVSALSKALATYKVPNTCHQNGANLSAAIQSATNRRPLILLVEWSGGGGHWVVIAANKGTAQIILDPYYGLQFNNSVTQYGGIEPVPGRPHSVTLVSYGRWQPYWLQVN